jgi:hypothetical protein
MDAICLVALLGRYLRMIGYSTLAFVLHIAPRIGTFQPACNPTHHYDNKNSHSSGERPGLRLKPLD